MSENSMLTINGTKMEEEGSTLIAYSVDGSYMIRLYQDDNGFWSYAKFRWDPNHQWWGMYKRNYRSTYYERTDALQAARSDFEGVEF